VIPRVTGKILFASLRAAREDGEDRLVILVILFGGLAGGPWGGNLKRLQQRGRMVD